MHYARYKNPKKKNFGHIGTLNELEQNVSRREIVSHIFGDTSWRGCVKRSIASTDY